MAILHNRILWQVLLGAAALICFATAISWIRATYRMYKAGDARPLLLPFPVFMWMDIFAVMRRMNQNRFPPELQDRLEKMQFESIITNNYLKAVMLIVFGIVAASIGFMLPR